MSVLCGCQGGEGNTVEVLPFVPILLGGISSTGRVKDAFYLDSWILGSGHGPGILLRESRATFWDLCGRRVGLGALPMMMGACSSSRYSMSNPRKRVFRLFRLCPQRPEVVPPLDDGQERPLVLTPVSGLRGKAEGFNY